MSETWKEIKDFPNYMISNKGRVWSKTKIVSSPRGKYLKKGRILKSHDDKRGYLKIDLINEKGRKSYKIHRLVAEAFLKNPELKREVNHINGIKTDNEVSNLEWVTSKENKTHAWNIGLYKKQNGLKFSGEKNGFSKLNDQTVKEIRRTYKSGGISQKELGRKYNTSQTQISYIVNRITWKHVEEELENE